MSRENIPNTLHGGVVMKGMIRSFALEYLVLGMIATTVAAIISVFSHGWPFVVAVALASLFFLSAIRLCCRNVRVSNFDSLEDSEEVEY
ncbi:MAG: hypothetical protein WC536_04975 [Patescibacteria group bacterium]